VGGVSLSLDLLPRHKKGTENVLVDALSRRYAFISGFGAKFLGLQLMLTYYFEDPAFQELVINTLAQGPYVMQEGFLFKGNKLCVSTCLLRELLVTETYGRSLVGHFGLNKTLGILREYFFWPKIGKTFTRLCLDAPSTIRLRVSSIKACTPHFQFP